VVAVALLVPAPAPAQTPDPQEAARSSAAARRGVQQVPKRVADASTATSKYVNAGHGANPYLSLLPDPTESDHAYWREVLAAGAAARAAGAKAAAPADGRSALAVGAPVVDEDEPDLVRGGNDTQASAQHIADFGSGPGQQAAVRILGTLAPRPAAREFRPVPEENGSIRRAGSVRLSGPGTRSKTSGVIGDGRHGSNGDGKADLDFYRLDDAEQGQTFEVAVTTPGTSRLDAILVLWKERGRRIAFSDDEVGLDPALRVRIPRDGDYFVSVSGFPSVPRDPFDSGSGGRARSEGEYRISFGLDATEIDYYSLDLQPGDVIGASVNGAATELAMHGPAGTTRVRSSFDLSFIYPVDTPLPGGGRAVLAHVVDVAGRHAIEVTRGAGAYDVTLEVHRPGPQVLDETQTIFLDFDGARVNTGVWSGPGVRDLSPLSAFLGRWGLAAGDEDAVIDEIVQTVTESVELDHPEGANVEIVNSRDDADPWGSPGVTRIIVGGTIDESGIPTIGIAQSIDPGNHELEETALVLLDLMSAPRGDELAENATLNRYIDDSSDVVRFVGTAVGNVVAHEAGHMLGSFHVDPFNVNANLMDSGGNFELMFGVGPDGIGGTADDPDVDFGTDVYDPFEGLAGRENTMANTLWALPPVGP
jgi:hypothetical protein